MSLPTMFNQNPSDAIRLLGMGELPMPSKCMICGSGTCEDGYVDLGVYYDYEGEMLMCVLCIYKVSETAGCRPPSVVAQIEELQRELATENAALKEQLSDATNRLSIFSGMLNDSFSRIAVDGVLPTESAVKKPALRADNDSRVQSDVTGDESKSVKPVKSTRRGNSRQPSEFDSIRFDDDPSEIRTDAPIL